MFGVGGFELFLILLFGFLIFGPDKLPAIAETIGKAIAKFRSAQKKMDLKLDKNAFLSNDPEHPIKNPIEVLDNAVKSIDAMRSGPDNGTDKTGTGANTKDDTSKKPIKPGGAIENYPTFAERKAAYERQHGKDTTQAVKTSQAAQGQEVKPSEPKTKTTQSGSTSAVSPQTSPQFSELKAQAAQLQSKQQSKPAKPSVPAQTKEAE